MRVKAPPFTQNTVCTAFVALVKAKKASLVVIAQNVDPLSLSSTSLPSATSWVSPIVPGKARLDTAVHKKTAAVVALQDVRIMISAILLPSSVPPRPACESARVLSRSFAILT